MCLRSNAGSVHNNTPHEWGATPVTPVDHFLLTFLFMRTLLLAVGLMAVLPSASACDVCGCSIGGNYFGILPQFHRNFVGLRWTQQSFRSAHLPSDARAGRYDSEEYFQTADLLGRFYLLPRLQLFTLVPWHDFSRLEAGRKLQSHGLGDASVVGNFILLNTGDSLSRKWRHTLTIGGGVKLPTGAHSLKNNEGELLHANMQPGSGSTDVVLLASYTLRRGSWGCTADLMGRINKPNRDGYQFGHRANGAFKVFYWKNIRSVTLLPNAGVFADYSLQNWNGSHYEAGTGGMLALATLGLDVYLGRFSLGVNIQPPVYQHLGEGSIRANTRTTATANFIF
jgi:hypothetical protein